MLWSVRRYLRNRPRGWGERFIMLLGRHGRQRLPGETRLELARRLANEEPPLGEKALTFVTCHYHVEYGGREEKGRPFSGGFSKR